MKGIAAWCTCSHHESWHLDDGPCVYITTTLDDNGEWQIDSPDCLCGKFELQHVELL